MADSEKNSIQCNIEIRSTGAKSINDLWNDILKVLGNHNYSQDTFSWVEDSFNDANDDESTIKRSFIEISFKKPINLTNKKLKEDLSKVVFDYINSNYFEQFKTIKTVEIEPKNSKKIKLYFNNEKKCSKMIYTFGFKLEESIVKLIKYIELDKIKNSNKQLSKVLKEKIDNRLNKFIKK